MNFAKGILESRRQTYRHLKKLLKTIPLDTPTVIELRPDYEIRVTLFDANHCVGAVMFLIEGQGKAVLYTGDIRSEPWWVNQLVQNPILVPYAECLKTIDCIYLDTTFASKSDCYREFPSKADGLKEMLRKVSQYPSDTTFFYVEAWTFGYENVWIALSSLLNSQVHLDAYRWSLYKSLAATTTSAVECPEAHQMTGFHFGNHRKEGCLTADSTVRLHSCERGTSCPMIDKNPNVIRIVPIVSRLSDGSEMHELGIGGGKGDLDQTHELEVTDAATLGALMQLCASRVEDKHILLKIFSLLNSSPRINLGSDSDHMPEQEDVKLEELVTILSKVTSDDTPDSPSCKRAHQDQRTTGGLPKTITFPYSRHSSYSELCHLVQAFQPKDVYPCTVDEATWTPAVSMRALFGHLCSSSNFVHDQEMFEVYEERTGCNRLGTSGSSAAEETQHMISTSNEDIQDDEVLPAASSYAKIYDRLVSDDEKFCTTIGPSEGPPSPPVPAAPLASAAITTDSPPLKRPFPSSPPTGLSITPPARSRKIRRWAYIAAAEMDEDCESWEAFGGLKCVQKSQEEKEL
jgi:DNA cross-link repair 1C protein